MAGRTVRFCALALCLGARAALAAQVVDPASARAAIDNPAVAAQDAELAALAAGGRATNLAVRLERIAHDAALNAVAREWLLDRGLHAIAGLAPTPAARATVARLTARTPVVYAEADPDHGGRATPLYDAGATARFVLRAWDRDAARGRAQAELAAGSQAAVTRFAARSAAGGTDPVLEGIAQAFRAAPPPQLAAQRPAIVDAVAAGRRVDELALILAERLGDRELYELTVDNADEAVVLEAIAGTARALDPSSALAVLGRASRRADVASAAVLEIGRLAQGDAAARGFLFDALVDPATGPSAAAALGQLADPAVSAEIGSRLAGARSESDRRLLVLALRLDPDPEARTELRRFADSGTGSPHLRKEVSRWLER